MINGSIGDTSSAPKDRDLGDFGTLLLRLQSLGSMTV